MSFLCLWLPAWFGPSILLALLHGAFHFWYFMSICFAQAEKEIRSKFVPPWPNGQGVGLLIRRLRVRVPQGVHLRNWCTRWAADKITPLPLNEWTKLENILGFVFGKYKLLSCTCNFIFTSPIEFCWLLYLLLELNLNTKYELSGNSIAWGEHV